MKRIGILLCLGIFILQNGIAGGADLPVSEATAECIDCHAAVHPGIVSDWQHSRHAKITPVSYTHLTLPTNVSMCRSRWAPYH